MSTNNSLSDEDQEFLAECEEEFKDRYTEKDANFMEVFNADKSTPPIVDAWVSQPFGQRDRRRFHPYERRGYRDNNRRWDRRDRDGRDRDGRDRDGRDYRQDNYSRGYKDYHNREY